MVKLIIAAALLAIAFAAPAEKIRVPSFRFLAPRDPFPKIDADEPVPTNVELRDIVQRLDNFDPSNTEIWGQRYYENLQYYTPGSPIFLFLAGEWIITPYRLTNSLMHDIASEIDAAIFYLEHRVNILKAIQHFFMF